jgi:hypothetical protein
MREPADEHPRASARPAAPFTVDTLFSASCAKQGLVAAWNPMLELGLVDTKACGGLEDPLPAHTSSGCGVAAVGLQ